MEKQYNRGLVWFRRDLRAYDHAALYHALKACREVFCLFVFDRTILDALPRADRRVEFIRESLVQLHQALRLLGQTHGVPQAGLIVVHDWATQAVVQQAQTCAVQAVFTNHDDEPSALARDAAVAHGLSELGMAFHSFKDHVIFERDEVVAASGKPYSVFTPYKNAWLKKVNAFYLRAYPLERYAAALANVGAPGAMLAHQRDASPVPSLQDLGFEKTNLSALNLPTGTQGGLALWQDFTQRMDHYHDTRNFPAVKGPSYLGVHLRFGTVSIRQLAQAAYQRQGNIGAETWLNELIWRDFYAQILHHAPHVVEHAFKPEYNAIAWEQGPAAELLFQAWRLGKTGYPLVDAAMAQLNQTGYMHNRLRMVTACFLTKDLGIDWRWGERYFAEKLNDFDLASNNGGWQWAASSGCDAQPYFRIFNPLRQSVQFDADGKFIRKYLPVLSQLSNQDIHAPWLASASNLAQAGIELGVNYPQPLVQHDQARKRTLERYAVVKKSA